MLYEIPSIVIQNRKKTKKLSQLDSMHAFISRSIIVIEIPLSMQQSYAVVVMLLLQLLLLLLGSSSSLQRRQLLLRLINIYRNICTYSTVVRGKILMRPGNKSSRNIKDPIMRRAWVPNYQKNVPRVARVLQNIKEGPRVSRKSM